MRPWGRVNILRSCEQCGRAFTEEREPMARVLTVCSVNCFLELMKSRPSFEHGLHELVDRKLLGPNDPPRPGYIKVFTERMTSMRSHSEENFCRLVRGLGIEYFYEPYVFYMLVDGRPVGYVPDFALGERMIEIKGIWTLSGRKKVEAFFETFPEIPLHVVNDELIGKLRRNYDATFGLRGTSTRKTRRRVSSG